MPDMSERNGVLKTGNKRWKKGSTGRSDGSEGEKVVVEVEEVLDTGAGAAGYTSHSSSGV
jgi:hypothetical protein